MRIQTSFLDLAGGGNARGAAGIAQTLPNCGETHILSPLTTYKKSHTAIYILITLNILLVFSVFFSSCGGSASGGAGDDIPPYDNPPPVQYTAMAAGGTVKYADSSGNLSDSPDADTVTEIHLFMATDNLVVTTAPATDALVTAIAGGGGGGGSDGRRADFGGGGGAGGVVKDKAVTMSDGTYAITIGVGGAGGAGGGNQGTNGGNTIFSNSGGTALVTANGGGGGGSGNLSDTNLAGKAGGSGGGGGTGSNTNVGNGGASTDAEQGNNGGKAVSGSNSDPGAGGGGAGGAGQNSAEGGGAGGPGIEILTLSELLGDTAGTLYAAGGKGGGLTSTQAIDGQNYGDGGGAPCQTTHLGYAVPGRRGHGGVLYIAIPYTQPVQ
jgi:hypothetical protein